MFVFENTSGKNPNMLHDYLIENDCEPVSLNHNAKYNENGEKTQEATEIYIAIDEEKEQMLSGLVNQFMSQ